MISNNEISNEGLILYLSMKKVVTMFTEKNLDMLLNFLRDSKIYIPMEKQFGSWITFACNGGY